MKSSSIFSSVRDAFALIVILLVMVFFALIITGKGEFILKFMQGG